MPSWAAVAWLHVYRATDTRRNLSVALKVLPSGYIQDERMVRRFLREGESVVRLRHPNVVHVYETGQADGYFYIAMEPALGGTLSDRIRQRTSLANHDIAAIVSQVAEGLDYAHGEGLVHRDIKPSNIMFTQDGRVILTDFGIVKDLNADQSRITMIGTSIGTPAYMSPEQARADQRIDARSDIYSLGVVAYHLLTGRVPFQATSHAELINLIATRQPPPAQQINPRVSVTVSAVLAQAMSIDPKFRFPTARNFARALSQALEQSAQAMSVPPREKVHRPKQGQTKASTRRSESSRSAAQIGLLLIWTGAVLAVGTVTWLLAGILGFDFAGTSGSLVEPVTLSAEGGAGGAGTPESAERDGNDPDGGHFDFSGKYSHGNANDAPPPQARIHPRPRLNQPRRRRKHLSRHRRQLEHHVPCQAH